MFTQQPHDIGVPSFRDQTYKDRGTSLGARNVAYAHLIKEMFPDGTVSRDNSHGDILGSVLVKDGGRGMASWFHACPAVKTADGFLPIRDKTFTPDTGYETFSAATFNNTEIPNGTPGIVLAATKEDGDQELLFFGSSDGVAKKLIAANRNGPYQYGTDVHDLNEDGELDPGVYAKLQSAWKVMLPSYAPTSGSTSAPANLFNMFAQGLNAGLAPNGGALTLVPKQNNGSGTATVGILPNGAGGINLGPDPSLNPLSGNGPAVSVGVGNTAGGLNIGGGGPGNVGVGFSGGGINTGPGQSNGPLFGGGAGGFGTSPSITT